MPNLLWVLLIVVLIFALVGAPGIGPWNHQFGYYPTGIGVRRNATSTTAIATSSIAALTTDLRTRRRAPFLPSF